MSTRHSTAGTYKRVTKPRVPALHPSKANKPPSRPRKSPPATPPPQQPRKSPPPPPQSTHTSPARSTASAPARSRKRTPDHIEDSSAEDEHPPPKRRKASQKAKKVVRDEVDEDDRVLVDPALLQPTWADPLMELNPRASHATRLKERYDAVYLNGRFIGRNTVFAGPAHKIISYAVAMHGIPPEDRPCSMSPGPHPDDTFELAQHALVAFFPDWDKAVPILKKDPSLIAKLGGYIDKVAGKTRSDDLVRLKKQVIWAAGYEDPKGVLALKRNRGFNHQGLARMLCPKAKLDQFDNDPETFCQDVLDGKELLRSCDWFAALYDLDRARRGEYRRGLLMSEFLVLCYLILFCSKNSSDYETTTNKKKKGQPSLARKYGIVNVTLLQIIYTACLARFCITDIGDWTPTDGAWSATEFAESIFDLAFKNPTWHENLVNWWTRKIYGPTDAEEMSQYEFEHTAFYIAMNLENDDNDDFEDHPRRVAKPKRPVGPVRRVSPPQKSPTPVPTPPRRVSPPQKSATPVPPPAQRPGQTQIRRMTTPPTRPRRPTTPASRRETTDPRSLEEYWDEQIANAAPEKPKPFWDDEYSGAEDLEQAADPDANDDDEDVEGRDEDEDSRGLAWQTEQRHGVGWRNEENGSSDWCDEQDSGPGFDVKREREGTAGLVEYSGESGDEEDMADNPAPVVSDVHAHADEEYTHGSPAKNRSNAGSPSASMKEQLAALLADGATDEDLNPEEQQVLSAALARFQELAKARVVEEKKQRNKEKVMAKKRAARHGA